MIKKFAARCAALLLGFAVVAPIPVVAKEAGDIVVRLRAAAVIPDEGGAADNGTTNIGGDTSLDADVVPEVDFT